MILLPLSLFFCCYHDVLFLLGTSNTSAKLQKKKPISRKTSMT